MFLCQSPSLCPDYILTACIRVSSSFSFFAKSLYLLSLYLALHFLSMWLSGIIAIMNSNCDWASLWNILIIITLIMSRWLRGSFWPSPATLLYRPLLQVGLQTHILYQHKVVMYTFYRVVLPLVVHVKEYVAFESVLTSQTVSRMSGSSNFDSFLMGGTWPYSCCFIGCCLQDLFNMACSTLV